MKRRKWLIALIAASGLISLLLWHNTPIIVGEWTKQTLYLWGINCFHFPSENRKPKILLIDDDGEYGIFVIKQLCKEIQMKATFAIVPEKMDQVRIDSIRAWFNDGFGLALHGYKHDDWRNLTYQQVLTDIEKCEKWLQQNHFDDKAIKYVVSPHGSNTHAVRDAIKYKGYQMVTGANILNPDTEVFQLGRVMITKETDLEGMRVWLTKAKERNLFVIFGTHSSIPNEFSIEKTRAVLNMAKDMGFEYEH